MNSNRRTRPRRPGPYTPQQPDTQPTRPAPPDDPSPGGPSPVRSPYPQPGQPYSPQPSGGAPVGRPYPGALPTDEAPPGTPPVYYHIPPRPAPPRRPPRKRRLAFRLQHSCLPFILAALLPVLVTGLYLFAPGRINMMILGIDYVDPANPVAVGRSDTLMMASLDPPRGYVGIISVPRDLWVAIPGVGENRINTAHFFAESAVPGSGPQAVRETIKLNFGVDLRFYIRFRFESFRDIVDAMGGVDITLEEPMAGYSAGKHHLTGRKALAFVRDRANSDDFFRMSQGQLMIKAMMRNLLNPLKWIRIPAILRAFFRSVDTNLPVWLWPRLAFTLLRAGPGGIDSHIINRDMVSGFTTSEGAMVLAPNWPAINDLVYSVFR